jgi:hypothetical protein
MKFGRKSDSPDAGRSDGSLPAVMRPIPLALLAYALVWWIVMLFMGTLLTSPDDVGALDQTLFASLRASHLFLVVHLGWLILLLIDCRSALNSPPDVRKGHLAGAFLGVALSAALCLWALRFAGWLTS